MASVCTLVCALSVGLALQMKVCGAFPRRVSGQTDQAPVISKISPDRVIPLGSNTTLICNVTDVASSNITWKLIRGIGKTQVVGFGSTYDVINVNDSTAGLYVCEVHSSKATNRADVIVDIQEAAPKVTVSQTSVKVKSGSNVTVSCTATGFPQPLLEWGHFDALGFPENADLVSGASTDSMGTLHLTKVTNRDAGRFVCRATNRAGRDMASVHVTVVADDRDSAGASTTPDAIKDSVPFGR